MGVTDSRFLDVKVRRLRGDGRVIGGRGSRTMPESRAGVGGSAGEEERLVDFKKEGVFRACMRTSVCMQRAGCSK